MRAYQCVKCKDTFEGIPPSHFQQHEELDFEHPLGGGHYVKAKVTTGKLHGEDRDVDLCPGCMAVELRRAADSLEIAS